MQYLQYIQPTGNRQTYTDTNLAITDVNTRFVFEYLYYEQPSVPGSNWSELIGTGYPNRIMIGTMSQSVTSTPNIYVMWRNVQERVDNYIIDGTATFSKNGLTVNGTQVITISNPPSSIEAGVLCIGGVHNAAGDELVNSGIKIGRLKVYDGNDNLIGDFVPANNNGTIGFYDEVGQVFYDSDGSQPWIAGPAASSISADASKSTLASTGETISISVSCENAWTVTGDTFLTLSSTGDTGSTTITATAPSYTGATARTDTLTFTDSVTGDEWEIDIKQKKYSTGQPFYLGADEIVEIYLGDDFISEAYLGEDLVFSTGPFEGLKVSPKSLSFNSFNALTANVKIKSSEAWSMTVPAWITASTLTGDTGDTIVSLTATTQTATTTGSIVVTSANYSASASCFFLIGVPQLQIDGVADISTSFSPYAAYTGNSNYLKCEISAEWTGSRNSGAYLYACNESVPFFSCERFRTNDIPYCNIGNGGVSDGPENGGGLDHTWVFKVNGNNVATFIDGDLTQTKTISGNWPTGNLSFAKYSANNLHINFYWVKFWGANNTLLAEFVPDSSGGILDKVSNTVYPKVGTGTTSYSLVIPPAPPIPTGSTRTLEITDIPTPPVPTEPSIYPSTWIQIQDPDNGTVELAIDWNDNEYDAVVTANDWEGDPLTAITATYSNGTLTAEGDWGDNIYIQYSYYDEGINCEKIPDDESYVEETFTGDTISLTFPTLVENGECQCGKDGGDWDGDNEVCVHPTGLLLRLSSIPDDGNVHTVTITDADSRECTLSIDMSDYSYTESADADDKYSVHMENDDIANSTAEWMIEGNLYGTYTIDVDGNTLLNEPDYDGSGNFVLVEYDYNDDTMTNYCSRDAFDCAAEGGTYDCQTGECGYAV